MSPESFVEKIKTLGINAVVFDDIKFSLKEKRRKRYTKERPLIMVSLYEVSDDDKEKLKTIFDEYRSSMISFPIKERSKHLMVHFQDNIINFGYWPIPYFSKFRVWPSKLPSRATIEPVVPMLEAERKKLRVYIDNIIKKKTKVIGHFHNEGYQETKNTLEDNRAFKRGHNCSSWIATAPISENGQAFLEELGTKRKHLYGTNPGWWSAWLLSSANRNVAALYWDLIPLDEMKNRIDKDRFFTWDFKRM